MVEAVRAQLALGLLGHVRLLHEQGDFRGAPLRAVHQVLDGGGARRAAGGAQVHKAVGSGEALARMQEQQQINISP